MRRDGIKGIVLAGGKSTRFGQDKALARLDGVTLLERAVKLLRKLNLEPVVMTSREREHSFLNCRIEKDLIPNCGPIGGLYTACLTFPNTSLLVLTCDMPALTTFVLETLLNQHDRQSLVTLFCTSGNQTQPFPGLYESRLSGSIKKEAIEKNKFSMHDFLSTVPEKKLIRSEFSSNFFFNINTKEDMKSWTPSFKI
ncbi:MAG: hypothetical protein A3G87_07090 [Omnitrophica bacterium RIFCSPLOWO2_12_FULL_50_11]|nr:MAG: hypothetical protein A3G87_07090 [Omnitrophica bacterium RIFCSPLOWO2_12_FULL_50_11]